jgi:hypothetical protein
MNTQSIIVHYKEIAWPSGIEPGTSWSVGSNITEPSDQTI